MRYKLTLLTLSAVFATVLTGCASSLHPFGEDHLTVTGTPAGFDSFFDGIDNISQSAKGDPHKLTNAARNKHDKELTKRHAITLQLGRGGSNAAE